jgi:Domain of unknown function (DUF397)
MDVSCADGVTWRKSSASTTSNCVEVAIIRSGALVRDTKDRAGAVLSFTKDEWAAFLSGVRAGEFDATE